MHIRPPTPFKNSGFAPARISLIDFFFHVDTVRERPTKSEGPGTLYSGLAIGYQTNIFKLPD